MQAERPAATDQVALALDVSLIAYSPVLGQYRLRIDNRSDIGIASLTVRDVIPAAVANGSNPRLQVRFSGRTALAPRTHVDVDLVSHDPAYAPFAVRVTWTADGGQEHSDEFFTVVEAPGD
jgi:hypothetical protein